MPNTNNTTTMSLKAAPIQFAEFKPIEYKPVEIDSNILNRSMEKIEARRNQAYQEYDAFKRITAPLRDKLNAAEYAAFDARVEGMKYQVDHAIQNGNYGQAYLLASKLGGDLVSAPDIQNKIKVEEQRNKKLDEINKGKYDETTKLRYEQSNPYIDDGSGEYKERWTPYTSISLDSIFQQATNTTPTRQSSNSWNNSWNNNEFTDEKGNITKAPGDTVKQTKTTSTSKGGSKSVTSFTLNDQMNSFYALLEANPQYDLSMRQAFENDIWAINYYRNKLNEATTDEERQSIQGKIDEYTEDVKDENGLIPTSFSKKNYETWRDRKAKQYFNSKTYTHISTGTSTSNNTSYGLPSKGDGSDNVDGKGLPDVNSVTGLGGGIQAERPDATRTNTLGDILPGVSGILGKH